MAMLSGKVVVIAGGTTGLGLSAVQACVGAGARVVAFGRNPQSVERAKSEVQGEVRFFAADATDAASAERAIQMAIEAFGGFHALYHVAGGSGRSMGDGPLHEVPLEGWEATLRLNLTSVFLSNRAAVRQFLRDGTAGAILNMGSVLGMHPSPHFFATHAYAAAKSAIIGLMRSCAACYAPQNVRFNVIVPALVETPMSQRAINDQVIQQFVRTKQPLDGGRAGMPQDLDAAVVFLLSDGARFVTGQVLCVDGGWSVSEGQVPREAGR